MGIYDYSLTAQNGQEVPMANYKGKVLMIVNTATKCGFTPQYKELSEIYDKYKDKGLEIIDIPCNQFAEQAPGTDEEINIFCSVNYGTKFPRMKKSDVNGADALPIYNYLKAQKGFEGFGKGEFADLLNDMLSKEDPDYARKPDIKWNFTKFIVDRDGNVVKRFEPTADMKEVEAFVAKLL